ncbi:MAG: hypothetical protein HGA37_00275 [Lentimicrobium sp.]|nr:hypothetical protein [Lentimicrobium sp.]
MDDFLYIIIGILWVAYSLYSNKQKQDKKRAAREAQGIPSTQESPPKRSLLEEILMGELRPVQPTPEALEEEWEPEYTNAPEAVSLETIKTEAESLEVITDEVPANYFEKEYAGRKEERSDNLHADNETIDETEEHEFEIARNFDIRTAVIYAEILNPRYI